MNAKWWFQDKFCLVPFSSPIIEVHSQVPRTLLSLHQGPFPSSLHLQTMQIYMEPVTGRRPKQPIMITVLKFR